VVDQDKVARALRSVGDTVTIMDLVKVAEGGGLRAWTEGDSLLLAGVHNEALVFHLAVGGLDSVLGMLEEAYDWGREHGATRAVFIGRRGWTKPLQKIGWAVTGRLLLYERQL